MNHWHATLGRMPEFVTVEPITDDGNMKGWVWIAGRQAVSTLELFETESEALEAAWNLRNTEIERLQSEQMQIAKRKAEIEIKEQT